MKFIATILGLFLAVSVFGAAGDPYSSTTVPAVSAALITNSTALTGGNVYVMLGGGTAPGPSTNIPSWDARSVAIGANGFGITVNMSGTNATTSTNAQLQFQFSGDGVNWATNNLLSINACPPGTTYFPCYTNIANTVPNVGNAMFVRLYSFHHTNTASIFVTNINISSR